MAGRSKLPTLGELPTMKQVSFECLMQQQVRAHLIEVHGTWSQSSHSFHSADNGCLQLSCIIGCHGKVEAGMGTDQGWWQMDMAHVQSLGQVPCRQCALNTRAWVWKGRNVRPILKCRECTCTFPDMLRHCSQPQPSLSKPTATAQPASASTIWRLHAQYIRNLVANLICKALQASLMLLIRVSGCHLQPRQYVRMDQQSIVPVIPMPDSVPYMLKDGCKMLEGMMQYCKSNQTCPRQRFISKQTHHDKRGRVAI